MNSIFCPRGVEFEAVYKSPIHVDFYNTATGEKAQLYSPMGPPDQRLKCTGCIFTSNGGCRVEFLNGSVLIPRVEIVRA